MYHSDLVLIGGGHTHVLLIRSLAMRPIPGVRVTLVSESTLTPYSGMLPGFVAGHYTHQLTTIDLNQLCRRAGVRWIKARATGLDADAKHVLLDEQAGVSYDRLSIDIGSTPDLSVEGARQNALGVKPIANFQHRWNSLLEQPRLGRGRVDSPVSEQWGVIGAGAGGVELVLAMAHRMQHCAKLKFHLVYRGPKLLPGYPAKVVSTVERRMRAYGITLHPNFSVREVTATGIVSDSEQTLALSESIWCTGALGAQWPAAAGLAATEKNFICVNRFLQSTSHASIFAAGDIAEMIDDPRPKAGVYAVRQAPLLEENLRRAFAGQALRAVKLQSQFLSLLSLGGQEAIASRNGLAIKGAWVWRWKNHIDQKFMRQFSELKPPMNKANSHKANMASDQETMHCGGCGSKLGPDLLMNNLSKIKGITETEGENSALAEDASIWSPTPGMKVLQSVDGFRSFTSNEYLFGKICVSHALSDVYAMGAAATRAQAWVNLSFSHPRIHQRDHLRILSGVVDALTEQGSELIGGHSTEGVETHLAIVANGEVLPAAQWMKSGAKAGDVIVLSKDIGVGVILAADMQGEASPAAIEAAYKSMLVGNISSMRQLQANQPHAVTDVTGFGLLGHLLEMLDSTQAQSGEGLTAILNLASLPLLPGARGLALAGWRSSLYSSLRAYLGRCQLIEGDNLMPAENAGTHPIEIDLLLDPQTSGGLIACLSEADALNLLDGNSDFIEIGRIKQASGKPEVHLCLSGLTRAGELSDADD